MNYFRSTIFPLTMILILPILLITLIYYTNTINRSLEINMFSILTFLFLIVYGYLSIILSPKKFKGPRNVDNVKPSYASNGFEFYIFSVILTLFITCNYKKFTNLFVKNFIPITLTFTLAGYIFVTYLYLKSKDSYFDKESDTDSEIFKFYRGLEFHPKIFDVDVKQLTNCRFGMICWQIFIIIFTQYYLQNKGTNYPIIFSTLLQSIYIAKFFYWETGYFNTLDITLDKAGFYICWGCLVFVPCFYTFATYYMINHHPKLSFKKCLLIFIIGMYFVFKNYQIDKQKQDFKSQGEKMKINNKPVEYIDLYNLEKQQYTKFLMSGAWGKARHANYTYEMLLSLSWCLFGYNTGPMVFSYVAYIVILLVHRIKRDEEKCLKKYGKDYKKYMTLVPYRLIPMIY